MTLFDRVARVTIGSPGGGGLRISELRISFDISKDDGKDANDAKIDIYNLSEASRRRIDEIDELVFLEAGYADGDGLETLFIGNITNISHSITPPDVLTSITANDGSKEMKNAKSNFSFASGISGREVLRKVLQSFSISSDFNNVSFTDKNYANGFSFVGSSTDALTKVTQFLGLSWSIQNNEIKLVQFDGNDGSRIVLLSPETGMIGSPEKELFADRTAKGDSKKVDVPGWRIRSLLQPKIVPTNQIVVNSREVPQNSLFTVMTVVHSGDTHGVEWSSVVEVKE